MQLTGKRIFSAVMLVAAGVTTYQLLSKPQPVAAPQSVESARLNAQSFDQKLEQLQAPRTAGARQVRARQHRAHARVQILKRRQRPLDPALAHRPRPVLRHRLVIEPSELGDTPV